MGPAQNFTSISRRPPDVEDYIDMFRRYRSWIIGPMFLGLVVSVVVAFLWPDTYVSMAVMRITPQQVPEKLVPSALTTQMADRLQQMETDILSRTSLQEIIQKPSLDLYKKERLRLPMEDIVQDMRNKAIRITPLAESGSGGPAGKRYNSAFAITFSYADRYKAQAVVRELVTKFTEQNVQVQRTQVTLTTNFLNDELKAAKEKMDTLDGEIVKFKIQNQGRLPEQASANANAQSMLQMQLISLNQQINRNNQDKMLLEQQLQNLKNTQNFAAQGLETTVGGEAVKVQRNEKLADLYRTINDLRGKLTTAREKMGKGHPDVADMEGTLALLEKERNDVEKQEAIQQANLPSATPTVRTLNPAVQKSIQELEGQQASVKAQLAARQMEIEGFQANIREIEGRIATYQKHLEEAPLNEQQYAALLREFNLAKQDYEDMKKRRDTSETAQNLEEHKAGENLEVLDPASLPEVPSEPNRPAWAGIGTFAGLGLGIVLAAAQEVKNTSLKNLKDVRAYTNMPVLSSIPLLENALLVRRKRRLVWLAWSGAIIIGSLLMSGSMYYRISGL